MSNLVLPALPGLVYPVTKTPMWSTTIQESTSGKETRIGHWSYPRWQYSIGYEFMRSGAQAELQALAGFFNNHQGSFDSWLFRDPDDNTVTLQGFGIGDGVTKDFQLSRALGGYLEPVQALNGAANIFNNGTLQTAGSQYTINSTGLVSFVTSPAVSAVLAWTGQFYWRCRFMDDQIDLSKFMNQLWELKTLNFKSVK